MVHIINFDFLLFLNGSITAGPGTYIKFSPPSRQPQSLKSSQGLSVPLKPTSFSKSVEAFCIGESGNLKNPFTKILFKKNSHIFGLE